MGAQEVLVFVGIGSNIQPQTHVDKAIELLNEAFTGLHASKRYLTDPLGFEGDQFINMVVSFYAPGNLNKLREKLALIEVACGRAREQEEGKGSRTLDLDLLLFGELVGDFDGVTLPRTEIFERQFVWQPLLELLKKFEHQQPYYQQLQERLSLLKSEDDLIEA